jgi:hypothetical protein
VPLAKHVTAIIDASKQEVEVAAKAYYTAKVCSLTVMFEVHSRPASTENHVDQHMGHTERCWQLHQLCCVLHVMWLPFFAVRKLRMDTQHCNNL